MSQQQPPPYSSVYPQQQTMYYPVPSAPPPQQQVYYYQSPSQTTPLIQEQTVVVQTKPTSKCCGVSSAICCFFFIFCFVIFAIIGGVFGAWAVRCSSISVQKSIEHSTTFVGSNDKTILIHNHGKIDVQPSFSLLQSVSSISVISAPSSSVADDVKYQFYGSQNTFSLSFPYQFWDCPIEDVNVTVFDSLNLIGEVELDLESFAGDITVGNFSFVKFRKVSVSTFNGEVSIGRLDTDGEFSVFTTFAPISVSNAASNYFALLTTDAPITVSNLVAPEFSLQTSDGDITAQGLVASPLCSSCTCEIFARTARGEINVSGFFLLGTLTSCDIDLRTSDQDVNLSVAGFSGEYDISTSYGSITIGGSLCRNSYCNGYVPGAINHKLVIRTYNANVVVTFL